MEKSREYSRYRIGDPRILRGSLEQVSWPFQLATFGGGGCGFFCLIKVPSLVPPKRVFCSFALERGQGAHQLVRVQGNLIYVKEFLRDSKAIHFYGIEFIEPHRPIVEPIVQTLERLKTQGVIREA